MLPLAFAADVPALLDAPACAVAKTPSETVAYRHYDVGAGEGSLGERVSRASPVMQDGRRFHGHTHWRVDWHYDWQEHGGLFMPVARDVRLHARILLPRLDAGCPRQQHAFERYLECLHRHELGHVEFARLAAASIETVLDGLAPTASADALQRRARRAVGAVLTRIRATERQYDIETGHGRTQGAVLD